MHFYPQRYSHPARVLLPQTLLLGAATHICTPHPVANACQAPPLSPMKASPSPKWPLPLLPALGIHHQPSEA